MIIQAILAKGATFVAKITLKLSKSRIKWQF